jgi:hypothetical protein
MTVAYNARIYFDELPDAKRACSELRALGYRTVTQSLMPDDDFCVEAWLDEIPDDADTHAVNAIIEQEVVPIARRHDGFLYDWGAAALAD